MNDDELAALILNNATRHTASERLRAGVRTMIALQSAAREGETTTVVVASSRGRSFGWRSWGWRSALAGFVSGVALTLALTFIVPRLMVQDSLPAELVTSHVRSLKVGPLIEVASSDRHAVKPWFQGKLDYAPTVIDLESDGFPLLGGRVERVAGASVAALAYASQRHIVNVFVWPVSGQQSPVRYGEPPRERYDEPPRDRLQRSGFNLLHWNEGAMQVWLVSDVEASELERFGQAWRGRLPAR